MFCVPILLNYACRKFEWLNKIAYCVLQGKCTLCRIKQLLESIQICTHHWYSYCMCASVRIYVSVSVRACRRLLHCRISHICMFIFCFVLFPPSPLGLRLNAPITKASTLHSSSVSTTSGLKLILVFLPHASFFS
jgi:hypothetical protein